MKHKTDKINHFIVPFRIVIMSGLELLRYFRSKVVKVRCHFYLFIH